MKTYRLDVEGMGFEHGTVCISCVFAFLNEIKGVNSVHSAQFIITEKFFLISNADDDIGKLKKKISAALERAGLGLGKEFRFKSLTACD